MEKKKYSIASHLLHSRLQLVQSALIFEPDRMGIIQVSAVVWANKWLFHCAAKAVWADHGIEVTLTDQHGAAALLMQSRSVSFDGRYVVQRREGSFWRNVKTVKGNAGCVPAGIDETFPFAVAARMYCYITADANIEDFRVKKF